MQTATRWQDIAGDSREKYGLYLCSREWCELREAVRARSGGICERCKRNPMDAAHHLTYVRKYAERLEDLQAICNGCHEFTHGKSDDDPAATSYITGRHPFLFIDDRGILLCPLCGFDYLHPGQIEVRQNSFLTQIESLKSVSSCIDPSGERGSSIRMLFDGECGHRFGIVLQFHKGNTFCHLVEVRDDGKFTELWRD